MRIKQPLFSLLLISSCLCISPVFAVPNPEKIAPPKAAPATVAPMDNAAATAAATAAMPATVQPDTRPSKKASDDIIYRTNIGRADDVKLLLTGDASANDTNEAGIPLISLAASRTDNGSLSIIKILLENGADINKPDPRGQSPLFYAARSGNRTVAEYLLETGINYAATDRNGNTARNIAFQSDHNNIVELMDNFVRGKNDLVRKQYDEANYQLAERYKNYNESLEKESTKQANIDDSLPSPTLAIQRMKQSVHDISYASCALEYWTFASKNQQPTELGSVGLAQNIKAQREKAISLSREFIQTFGVTTDVIQKIVSTSVWQIDSQLNTMQTNTARRDQGVGTIDDMTTRCNTIANKWSTQQK